MLPAPIDRNMPIVLFLASHHSPFTIQTHLLNAVFRFSSGGHHCVPDNLPACSANLVAGPHRLAGSIALVVSQRIQVLVALLILGWVWFHFPRFQPWDSRALIVAVGFATMYQPF